MSGYQHKLDFLFVFSRVGFHSLYIKQIIGVQETWCGLNLCLHHKWAWPVATKSHFPGLSTQGSWWPWQSGCGSLWPNTPNTSRTVWSLTRSTTTCSRNVTGLHGERSDAQSLLASLSTEADKRVALPKEENKSWSYPTEINLHEWPNVMTERRKKNIQGSKLSLAWRKNCMCRFTKIRMDVLILYISDFYDWKLF